MPSDFFDAFSEWLSDPVVSVVVSPSDELQRLRSENQILRERAEAAEIRAASAELRYTQEATIAMRYSDLLKQAGIKFNSR